MSRSSKNSVYGYQEHSEKLKEERERIKGAIIRCTAIVGAALVLAFIFPQFSFVLSMIAIALVPVMGIIFFFLISSEGVFRTIILPGLYFQYQETNHLPKKRKRS